MTNFIKSFEKAAAGISDPTKGNSFVSSGAIDYLIGSLFILIGILIFVVFYRKSKKNFEKYKQEQLDLYNKNRNLKIRDYSKTSLYVPFWPRARASTAVMLPILFIVIGFFWIMWSALETPLTAL